MATEQYCPECDEPMEAWTPKADGSPRWVCDYHGVWSDPPQVISDDVWERATDPSIPPGVVRYAGRPFPLVEFEEPRDGSG